MERVDLRNGNIGRVFDMGGRAQPCAAASVEQGRGGHVFSIHRIPKSRVIRGRISPSTGQVQFGTNSATLAAWAPLTCSKLLFNEFTRHNIQNDLCLETDD